ncbi:MAG TPA: type II secretion system protein [Candidatus Limnocylindria bacterium]|nr:type II secretion system protein [Candidatus Limnocylindria bacterium]
MIEKLRFKERGFTLIEALMAMAIIAIIVTPLFVLYSTLFQTVSKAELRMDRVQQAQNFLIESERSLVAKTPLPPEKKVSYPPMSMTFAHGAVPADSPLSSYKTLSLAKVTTTWQEGKAKRSDVFVYYVYKPEEHAS